MRSRRATPVLRKWYVERITKMIIFAGRQFASKNLRVSQSVVSVRRSTIIEGPFLRTWIDLIECFYNRILFDKHCSYKWYVDNCEVCLQEIDSIKLIALKTSEICWNYFERANEFHLDKMQLLPTQWRAKMPVVADDKSGLNCDLACTCSNRSLIRDVSNRLLMWKYHEVAGLKVSVAFATFILQCGPSVSHSQWSR